MMYRRTFIGALPWWLGALPPGIGAQAVGRVYRLGILHSGSMVPASDAIMSDSVTVAPSWWPRQPRQRRQSS